MRKLTNFPYQNVLVLGLAKSGSAAAKLLLQNGVHVRVNDYEANEEATLIMKLKNKGADVVVGSHPLSVLDGIDVIVKNPGIPYDNILIVEAEKRNIPVITEIELAGLLANDNEIIGITGSNGKTTTSTLIAKMLAMGNKKVQLAGNIGVVATDIAEQLGENEKLVLELSSFQLLGIQSFRPHVAVLLNLFDAHLDYHGTIANYIEAKTNVFKNQTESDFLIYNADDARVHEVVKQAKSILVPFSVSKKHLSGGWIQNNAIYFKDEEIMSLHDIVLVGEHNLENILAAVSVAIISGATKEDIQSVLKTFSGVKHRLQFVANIDNRLFYNDSKATNILATQKALQSFKQPTILLAGGLDRGNSFESLLPFLTNVKAMVVFGETAEKLKDLAKEANIERVQKVKNVGEAANTAYQMSKEGDIILLSPACASWDQCKTFEERGDMFIQAVHILA